MKDLLRPIQRYFTELYSSLTGGWDRFWFTPTDPTTLAAIRICTGAVLLYVYISCVPALPSLIGPEAWIDDQAIGQLREEIPGFAEDGGVEAYRWWGHSVWFYVRDPAAIDVLYGTFLVAIICFMIGFCSRIANVLVWIGHLSFIHRSYTTWFGLDVVLAMLLLYMMFGPTGSALSVDRAFRVWRRQRSGRNPDDSAPELSWTANVVVRLIQVHLCVIYLCSGLAKLQGEMWWDGTAIWHVLMLGDLSPFDMRWLSQLPYWCIDLVSNLGVAATLIFEISFVFLIWNRMLRPLLLAAAVALHVGIGLFMGLGTFAAIMLTACLSFVPPENLRWLLDTLRGQTSGDPPARANVSQPLTTG